MREAIAEATAAFDAGNHIWGRFFLYVLLPNAGDPAAPDPAPVRAALQEAALAVPQSADPGELRAFFDALLVARRALTAFIAALPGAIRSGDVLAAPDAFAEAMTYIEPWIES